MTTMKRIGLIPLAVSILLSLFSCKYFAHSQIPPESEEDGMNIDVSKYYKNYGNYSNGLIWVEAESSNWNTEVKKSFIYLDKDGKEKSKWFSLDTYRGGRDFQNGFVVLYCKSGGGEVYDTSFELIASIGSGRITDFNSQGYAYAVGSDGEWHFISSSGLHTFEKPILGFPRIYDSDDLYKRLNNIIRVSKNNFVIVRGSSDPEYLYTECACVYDKKGKILLDVENELRKHADRFAVTSVYVQDDNTVKVYFYGTNKKRYVCTMDYRGSFLEYPKEI